MPITRRRLVAAGLSAAALACASRGGTAPAAGRSPSRAKPRPRTILILGGTGFLGPETVEAARARGHTVTLFNRGKTRPDLFPDVEKLRGDRDGQLDALRGRTWDAVIDNSGYVPRIVRMSAELLAPNVGRYLFVSSVSVYRDDIPAGADETAPVATLEDPANEDVRASYGALKAACEAAAERAMPARTAAIRPTLIVGPGDPTDRFTWWPVRLDRGGDVLAPGDGTDPVQLVDVRDLAAFLVALVEAEETGVYNAAGPAGTLTARAMIDGVASGTGARANLVWTDWPFLESQGVEPWSELPAWVPKAEGNLLAVSNARALAKGLRFRPLADTARDTLAWWKGEPAERRAKLRAGLAPEKEAKVIAAWRAR